MVVLSDSSDVIYMGLTEPCGDVFQPNDREHDQLETPPHMLTAEAKIPEGGANSNLGGAGMDEKTNVGGKILDKAKIGVGAMAPRFDAAGEEETDRSPEHDVISGQDSNGGVQQKCGTNTFTDKRHTGRIAAFSINPCLFTTNDTGTGRC